MTVPARHLAMILGVSSLVACSSQGDSSNDPIDGNLQPRTEIEIEVRHGVLESQFPDILNPSDSIEVARGAAALKFGVRQVRYVNDAGDPVGQTNLLQAEAVKTGSTIVYRGITQGADLVYKVDHGSVEQLLILQEKPIIPAEAQATAFELVEEVDFSGLDIFIKGEAKQLPARFLTDGPINFQFEGRTLFRVPKPEVRDASPGRARIEASFRLNLDENGKGVLSTVVPLDYLMDANREYPVLIDPAVDGHPCDIDNHCNDENPCTIDTCVAGGCEYAPNEANDGAECFASGFCVTTDSDDDGTPDSGETNPDDWCDFSSVELVGDCTVGGAETCRDGNPCTTDVCNPTTRECDNNADPAQEGNVCYDTGICTAGECVQQFNCTSDDACKTGKKCVEEVCVAGVCVEQNEAAFDGMTCLGVGTCAAGTCVLPPVGGECGGPTLAATACNDGNPCTVDSCDDGGTANDTDDDACENTGVPNGDGNGDGFRDTCYESGVCNDTGQCTFCGVAFGFPADHCDDANPCTVDSCAGNRCVHDSSGTDGNACLDGGACLAGLCVLPGATACGGPQACNDGNPCTDDSCNAAGECNNTPIADNTICWQTGACQAGACVFNPATACSQNAGGFGGGAATCDDGNPCTDDNCEVDGSCSHTPVNNGGVCWSSGTCAAGVCTF